MKSNKTSNFLLKNISFCSVVILVFLLTWSLNQVLATVFTWVHPSIF